ncbi:glycosyltransferase [Mesorhizobium sp. M0913]|uniref:glycosyltransferase family 2 protein n=1 Tax=Mesorhizobium sp. M0913 TaxID=2957026 RepID=UPI00333941F8
MPNVSIIIAAYNNARFLRRAIDSALAQSHPACEVIVVNDGSTDRTAEIMGGYGDRIIAVHQSNMGGCAARNRGLQCASGEFVKFLDADDYLALDSIAVQCRHSSRDGIGPLIVHYQDAQWIDEAGDVIVTDMPQSGATGHNQDFANSVAWVVRHSPLTSCPLHRKVLLDSVGGFDVRVPRSQEQDLHIRLALTGVQFVQLPGVGYFYQQHHSEGRVSNDKTEATLGGMLEACRRHLVLARVKFGANLPSVLAEAFGERLWRLGRLATRAGLPDLGTECFLEAYSVSPSNKMVSGSGIYRAAVSTVGAINAEKVGMLFAKLRR